METHHTSAGRGSELRIEIPSLADQLLSTVSKFCQEQIEGM